MTNHLSPAAAALTARVHLGQASQSTAGPSNSSNGNAQSNNNPSTNTNNNAKSNSTSNTPNRYIWCNNHPVAISPSILDLCFRAKGLKHVNELQEMDFETTWRDETLLKNLSERYKEKSEDSSTRAILRWVLSRTRYRMFRLKGLVAVELTEVCSFLSNVKPFDS
jgi:hypothetical protein